VDVIIGIEASPTQSFNCEGRIWTFDRPNVGVEFSPEMRKRLFEFTRDIVGEMIEIHIRDRCVFRAVVREPLGSEHAFQLSANDLAEAQALAQELKTGWRPVRTVRMPKSG
jgi:preprotein translocase subunit SecD